MRMARALLFSAAAGLATVALGQSGAVGPNVTRTYDIRDLTVRPALIYVSTSYTTLLEFEDIVLRVASAWSSRAHISALRPSTRRRT